MVEREGWKEGKKDDRDPYLLTINNFLFPFYILKKGQQSIVKNKQSSKSEHKPTVIL
jgi:hypothetical protein